MTGPHVRAGILVIPETDDYYPTAVALSRVKTIDVKEIGLGESATFVDDVEVAGAEDYETIRDLWINYTAGY